MTYEIPKAFLDHLAGQFDLARPVLFTGAGFSLGAQTVSKAPIPSASELRDKLWQLCFPGEPLEPQSSLADLFEQALTRHAEALSGLLEAEFLIATSSLSAWHELIFSFPWHRCYTLNIDDLAQAAGRRFSLPRVVRPVSAFRATSYIDHNDPARELQVVHLNGRVQDGPENLTFSTVQYGERVASHDPWYMALVAELLTRPFVFIGTSLQEPSLWQYIELRQERGERGTHRELRPRSYIVTPSLDRARQALLSQYNVEWLPLTGQQFAEKGLAQLANSKDKGLQFFASLIQNSPTAARLPEVADLATKPLAPTDYLLGQEPIWGDLQSGRAVERACDAEIASVVDKLLAPGAASTAVLITGTAGSGKSTSLMRICLKLVASGIRVAWVDRDTRGGPRVIRSTMLANDAPPVIAIDDADLLGAELAPIVRDVCAAAPSRVVLLGVRSGRVERVLGGKALAGVTLREFPMPPLEDKDIAKLIATLDRENRLGVLKGKPRDVQVAAFREKAGRQLLVAMIEATSGAKFEDKVSSELNELETSSQVIYSLVSVATSFRHSLAKDELLMAADPVASNQVLNLMDQLVKRHVIFYDENSGYRARHRVIADLVLDELVKTGRLTEILFGLGSVLAAKCNATNRNSKASRLLRQLINHEFVIRVLGYQQAKNLYGRLEGLLSWDYHYWLQRGSLELEVGLTPHAENFLNQAHSLAPNDPFVQTEFAYMQLRKASENPTRGDAKDLAESAIASLDALILKRGASDSYPYHVVGAQGLAWARRGIPDVAERIAFLQSLVKRLTAGCAAFPHRRELADLKEDLQRAVLEQAVPGRSESRPA